MCVSVCVEIFGFCLVWFCLVWFGSHHIVMQYNVLQTICFVSLLRFSFHSPSESFASSTSPAAAISFYHFIHSLTHSHISQYCSILFSFRLNFMAWILMFIHSIISLSSLLHSSNCFFLIKLLRASLQTMGKSESRKWVNVRILMWSNWNFW